MKQPSSIPHSSDVHHHHDTRSLPRRSRPSLCGGSTAAPLSPIRPSSAVPFSWEQQPGVPKLTSQPLPDPLLLPLPPPLRTTRSRKAGGKASKAPDPFAAAFEQCAGTAAPGRRRWPSGITDKMGVVLGLYGSCKTACEVVESAVGVRRPGGYGPMNRRDGWT